MTQELLRDFGFLSKYLNDLKNKLKKSWILILEEIGHQKLH